MPSKFQMNVSSVLSEGQLNDGFMKYKFHSCENTDERCEKC